MPVTARVPGLGVTPTPGPAARTRTRDPGQGRALTRAPDSGPPAAESRPAAAGPGPASRERGCGSLQSFRVAGRTPPGPTPGRRRRRPGPWPARAITLTGRLTSRLALSDSDHRDCFAAGRGPAAIESNIGRQLRVAPGVRFGS
jgi:hypothetical protein